MDEVTEMPSNSGDQVDSCCSDERCCGSQSPVVRSAPKVERNEPCPCDSGRKFKKCCGKTIRVAEFDLNLFPSAKR